jgi:hypothetical protein
MWTGCLMHKDEDRSMWFAMILLAAIDAAADALPDAAFAGKPAPTLIIHVPVAVDVSDVVRGVEWMRECSPSGCRFVPTFWPAQITSEPGAQSSPQRHDASQPGSLDDPASGSAGSQGCRQRAWRWRWRR